MTINGESPNHGRTLAPPELENTASIFTVSREDIFDYKRCPKIVAIKTYRTTRTKKPRPEMNEPKVPIRNIVGQIGEAAVRLAFSGTDDRDESFGEDSLLLRKTLGNRIAQLIMSGLNLMDKGIQMDLELLAKKTIEGLREIKPEIDLALGPMTVIGRGESRYGALPTCGYPDYVALSSNDKPVLIEVKNGSRENSTRDRFQASFYNSLGRTVGVVVHDTNVNDGSVRQSVKMHLEKDAETLVVYPRLHKWERVTDTVGIDQDEIEEIWSAKQLGIFGRWPDIHCESNCPHSRYKIVLPEDSLDTVAKPLPLIYAKGAADLGIDYNFNFALRYVHKTTPNAISELWNLGPLLGKVPTTNLEPFAAMIERRLGLGRESAAKLLRSIAGLDSGELSSRTRIDPRRVEKEMATYLEPWQRLLPQKVLDGIGPTAQSIGTQSYSLPRQSNLIIDKSWNKW